MSVHLTRLLPPHPTHLSRQGHALPCRMQSNHCQCGTPLACRHAQRPATCISQPACASLQLCSSSSCTVVDDLHPGQTAMHAGGSKWTADAERLRLILTHLACASLHSSLPVFKDALQGSDLENGVGHLPMQEGRPSVEAILRDMLDQSKASEASVHTAGACKHMICCLVAATA